MTRRKGDPTHAVQLGDLATDRITGYEGIVVAITDWLNRCKRITIQSRELKDGKPIESQTFDETDVVYMAVGLNEPEKVYTGGPGRAPDPTR